MPISEWVLICRRTGFKEPYRIRFIDGARGRIHFRIERPLHVADKSLDFSAHMDPLCQSVWRLAAAVEDG